MMTVYSSDTRIHRWKWDNDFRSDCVLPGFLVYVSSMIFENNTFLIYGLGLIILYAFILRILVIRMSYY